MNIDKKLTFLELSADSVGQKPLGGYPLWNWTGSSYQIDYTKTQSSFLSILHRSQNVQGLITLYITKIYSEGHEKITTIQKNLLQPMFVDLLSDHYEANFGDFSTRIEI